MSWLTDLFQTSSNTKDPFLKFLLRLTFVLAFCVLADAAFVLVSGGKIIVDGKTFYLIKDTPAANNNKTTANNTPAKIPAVARQQQPVAKTDTIKSADDYFKLNATNTKNLPHSIVWWLFFSIYSNWLLLIAVGFALSWFVFDGVDDAVGITIAKVAGLLLLLVLSSYANLLLQQDGVNTIDYNNIVVKTMAQHLVVCLALFFMVGAIVRLFSRN